MRTGTDSRANSRGQLLALGITKNLVEHGSSVYHDRVEGPVAVSRGEAPKVGLLTLRRRRSSDTICDGARSHLRLLFRVLAVEAEPVSPSRPRGLPTPLRLVGATLARPKPAAAHVFPGPETNQQGTLIQQPRRRRQLFSQPNLHRRRRRAIAAVTTSIASCIAAVAVALALVEGNCEPALVRSGSGRVAVGVREPGAGGRENVHQLGEHRLGVHGGGRDRRRVARASSRRAQVSLLRPPQRPFFTIPRHLTHASDSGLGRSGPRTSRRHRGQLLRFFACR
mmetsp:Transcript_82604/g.161080  ORF Transcript_82604/g.161080 Transcript_82604/m.161080 type:complete len:281 (-) Transcript_82604:316-1158(-)